MKNKKLRESYRDKPCIVCSAIPCDACHIKTYATRLKDEAFNMVPMCRKHHIEQGSKPWREFLTKYPQARAHLESLGWDVDEMWHPELTPDQ